MKTIEQIESELSAKIPRDVVSLRDGGAGRKLSYLEGWYVIDRLNTIFGPLNWAKEIIEIKEVVNTTNKGQFPAYIVKVRLSVIKPDHTVVIKEGFGYGADKSGLNAHELAIKEAVTDAMKVAAKDFGMSLGLALYDRNQENVEDEVQTVTGRLTSGHANIQTLPKDGKLNVKTGQSEIITTSFTPGYDVETIRAVLPAQPKTRSKEDLSKAIKSYFSVVEAQKRLTKDVFRSDYLGKYSASKVDDLNVEQSEEVLVRLKTLAETK